MRYITELKEPVTDQKVIRIRQLKQCHYCGQAYDHKKLMKCSYKGCKMSICKNCATFINNKPFCNSCVVELVRHDSLFIITTGKAKI